MGVAVGDRDNDGYEDLYVVAHGASELYQQWGWNVFGPRQPGVGGSGRSTNAVYTDLDGDGFQCLLDHKGTRLRLPVFKRFRPCAALFVPTARPCVSRMERTIQNRGATRDGDSAWSNLPKSGALLYGSDAAEGRVSPEPLVGRLLNRSDQQ